jgi:hypothetical protein
MTYRVEKPLKLTRSGQRHMRRAPANLIYSSEPPTEPGWYWHKHNGLEKVREVVARCDGVLYTWLRGIAAWRRPDEIGGEWAEKPSS